MRIENPSFSALLPMSDSSLMMLFWNKGPPWRDKGKEILIEDIPDLRISSSLASHFTWIYSFFFFFFFKGILGRKTKDMAWARRTTFQYTLHGIKFYFFHQQQDHVLLELSFKDQILFYFWSNPSRIFFFYFVKSFKDLCVCWLRCGLLMFSLLTKKQSLFCTAEKDSLI